MLACSVKQSAESTWPFGHFPVSHIDHWKEADHDSAARQSTTSFVKMVTVAHTKLDVVHGYCDVWMQQASE